jgi:hypothetical protein
MDFYDLPGYGEGGTVDPRPITVHKIGYVIRVSDVQPRFEDMFSPDWHGPETREDMEYGEWVRKSEEPPDDLDLYEEGWE